MVTKKLNQSIFREYDIRGLVPEELNSESVFNLGKAIGTYFRSNKVKDIVLGHDCRHSSPEFYESFTKGVLLSGCNVIGIGMVPTPCLSFATYFFDVGGGVQITGSHNPKNYNGFKITLDRKSIHGTEIKKIYSFTQEKTSQNISQMGIYKKQNIKTEYLRRATENLKLNRKIKVVVDAGNGIGGELACKVLRRIGAEVSGLFIKPDGNFPNHHPDPTIDSNLSSLIKKIRKTKSEIGIALDGDADRIVVVDSNGVIVRGDELLIILSKSILEKNLGASIVFDVKCSSRLTDFIKKMKGRPIMGATGHSLIRDRMIKESALRGGELSGHIFFSDDYYGFDDAIYTAARLVSYLSKSKETLSDFREKIPKSVSTPEIRIPCNEEKKFDVVNQLKSIFNKDYKTNEIDGIRISFTGGWALIRASNTEPALVLRFEAQDKNLLSRYEKIVYEKLRKFIEIKLP
ncbi:MAG: phosphomannomutase/phosphoglucomutase [Nitrospinota bacterium]|nr:phosphomannomutase/phosphoglucomutase [Nitrospinota bacterium]